MKHPSWWSLCGFLCFILFSTLSFCIKLDSLACLDRRHELFNEHFRAYEARAGLPNGTLLVPNTHALDFVGLSENCPSFFPSGSSLQFQQRPDDFKCRLSTRTHKDGSVTCGALHANPCYPALVSPHLYECVNITAHNTVLIFMSQLAGLINVARSFTNQLLLWSAVPFRDVLSGGHLRFLLVPPIVSLHSGLDLQGNPKFFAFSEIFEYRWIEALFSVPTDSIRNVFLLAAPQSVSGLLPSSAYPPPIHPSLKILHLNLGKSPHFDKLSKFDFSVFDLGSPRFSSLPPVRYQECIVPQGPLSHSYLQGLVQTSAAVSKASGPHPVALFEDCYSISPLHSLLPLSPSVLQMVDKLTEDAFHSDFPRFGVIHPRWEKDMCPKKDHETESRPWFRLRKEYCNILHHPGGGVEFIRSAMQNFEVMSRHPDVQHIIILGSEHMFLPSFQLDLLHQRLEHEFKVKVWTQTQILRFTAVSDHYANSYFHSALAMGLALKAEWFMGPRSLSTFSGLVFDRAGNECFDLLDLHIS